MIQHWPETIALTVSDSSMVGEARRVAGAMARECGYDETAAGKVAIVVSEAAKNLTQHAGGGQIILQPNPNCGLDVLALDKGRGMADLQRSMTDGYSTAGTAGIGLGAMARLSNAFDILSVPGRGTAIVCHFDMPGGKAPRPPRHDVGGVSVPMPRETVCGDGWASYEDERRVLLFAADGLGHGFGAAEASREAIRIFKESVAHSPEEILQRVHDALRKTRGAAASVAEIRLNENRLSFAGVGNVTGAIFSGVQAPRNLVCHNGTLGYEARKFSAFEYPWSAHDVLVLCSDGLTTHWRGTDYNGLLARRATLIAGVLYRDHVRGRDDATAAVVRGEGFHG